MIKAWTEEAWEDFEYWTRQDRKVLKRILQLLKDIDRNGYEGIGKPERLSGDLSSYWSRRIDDANRIVYRIAEAVGAQGGAHPGQQLAGAKGFGDVIVGSQIQRLDLVLLGGAGREHDDGGQELLPHKTDELQSVPVRQAQIQDDKVRIVGGEQGLAHGAGVGNKGLIAVGLQQRFNKAADVGLIFHDQNLEFVIAHLRFPPSRSIRSPARSGCWCPRPPCSRPGSRRRVP